MSARTRRIGAVSLHAVIAVLVAYAWNRMFAAHEVGTLDGSGWAILKYFTVLSNLFQGLVSLVTAVCLLLPARREKRWLTLLNYAAAVSVGLTFFTVMVYLGPVFGFPFMFQGSNLHFHLIVPVLSMLTWCFVMRGRIDAREIFFGVSPMLLYGFWYVGNLAVNGIEGNDFYFFAHRGWGQAPVSFALMIALAAAIAALLRLTHRKG